MCALCVAREGKCALSALSNYTSAWPSRVILPWCRVWRRLAREVTGLFAEMDRLIQIAGLAFVICGLVVACGSVSSASPPGQLGEGRNPSTAKYRS